MTRAMIAATAIAACLALAGCGKGKAPTGQVVATVDGDEITAMELRSELGAFNSPDPQIRKNAERVALQNIVSRKLLAEAAKEAKIDRTPEYARDKKRMEEALLVQSWRNGLVKKVPTPSREEALQFIAKNPQLYGNRQIYDVTQIRFARPADPAFVAALRPVKTIDELTQLLDSRGIRYQSGNGAMDSLSVQPRLLQQIQKLPPNELFVVPVPNGLVVNQIRQVTVVPFTGEDAIRHATQYMRAQRAEESVMRQFGSVVNQGKDDVKYNQAFAPPAPPAKAKAKAGAPAAAPKAGG